MISKKENNIDDYWIRFCKENDIDRLPYWITHEGTSFPVHFMLKLAFEYGYCLGCFDTGYKLAKEAEIEAKKYAHREDFTDDR